MDKNFIYKVDNTNNENDALILNETIFHNANGYIGIRSNYEEGYKESMDSIRGSYINGFYDIAEMKQAEKLYGMAEEKQTILNVADTQGILLTLDDETFSTFEGKVLNSTRYLDMKAGITVRMVTWESPKGKQVELVIKRMTSFTRLPLFTIEYSVKSINFNGTVKLESIHNGDVKNYCNPNDPRVAGESFQHLIPVRQEIKEWKENDTLTILTTKTAKSNLTVSTAVVNHLSKEAKQEVKKENHQVRITMLTDLKENETITLEKYSVFCDSIRFENCELETEEEMKRDTNVSLSDLYKEQKEYLEEFWNQSSLEIDGDEELDLAVRYNLYQLVQSVGKDEHSNIAAKGLSGEGYEGHFFWDTEMYMQPFFILTNPKIAKNLISYRYSILDAARENAKLLGHKQGALYPWRTIMGKECSGYFPAGTAQYHINGDIAYSIVAYYLATRDLDFIAEQGAEIIFETARLWIDTGNYYKGSFRINGVTGPDEYTCIVNNNYYTNASAKYNLYWAVKFYYLLEQEKKLQPICSRLHLRKDEIAEFQKAEEAMYLPYDDDLKINPQDDSFLQKPIWDIEHTPKEKFPLLLHYHPLCLYRYQVCKQADTVLAHFIFEDYQSIDTIKNSFLYYEKVTTHDSSLSTCIYSIVASKLGLAEQAYDYFGDSAKLDLFNTHKNTKDGIHTANMGGNYMAIVYGFGGLRLKENGIYFAPSLPKQWNGYRFKIHYENSAVEVEVTKNEVIFHHHGEKQLIIHVYGEEYHIKSELSIPIKK